MAGQLKRGDTARIRGLQRWYTVRVTTAGAKHVQLNKPGVSWYPADQLIRILNLPGRSGAA